MVHGSCLCREVAYEASGKLGLMCHCHCVICPSLPNIRLPDSIGGNALTETGTGDQTRRFVLYRHANPDSLATRFLYTTDCRRVLFTFYWCRFVEFRCARKSSTSRLNFSGFSIFG